MNLADIETRVAELDVADGREFIYALLLAYGMPKAGVTRLRSGDRNKATSADEVLWKERVWYRYADNGVDLHALIDEASSDDHIGKARPRFLIARDDTSIAAIDTRTRDSLDIPLERLGANAAFFLPWAGIEKTQLENLNYADVKAAAKMARLYDEIVKCNTFDDEESIHSLNVFFSRLLFCFFAEDTLVFEKGQFTNAVGSFTRADGSDAPEFLDRVFDVMNTPPAKRSHLPSHIADFEYVNGSLFDRRSRAPKFSAKARKIVLDCGTLDWSQINPDIFGSMIQAVVHPSQREGLGMHYTSVENILKVIRPLFLDDLHAAFDTADTVRKLEKLYHRMCSMKFFDPACGSGNFLVIAYKELRKLEHRILQRMDDLSSGSKRQLYHNSRIQLDHFFGIDVDDFNREIAILSLWLSKHQMNVEFRELFGAEIALIPLRDTGSIVCGNATRLDWDAVCPADENTFVMGNPPYLGSSMQDADQKRDFVDFFGTAKYPKNLDYIAIWFLKGARYIARSGAQLGFVSTNSVSQGDHVALMWPDILDQGCHVSYAYQSFLWSNSAKGNAGVSCVVIGLTATRKPPRLLYSGGIRQAVSNINPYLFASENDTIVRRASKPLNGLPEMLMGNKPTDGGHLILSEDERAELLESAPEAARFVRRYIGGEDMLKGLVRYCLWVSDDEAEDAAVIPWIADRFRRVTAFRKAGSSTAQAMADRPHRFLQRPHNDAPSIAVPSTSSFRRRFIPVSMFDANTVVSNSVYVAYDAMPWVLAILSSTMHRVWVETVAGRMKTDIRYTNTLCYHTFPVPAIQDQHRGQLAAHAFDVMEARELHPEKSLADLYSPDDMPVPLRRAHGLLDEYVDSMYRQRPFSSEVERQEALFSMYESRRTGAI